MPTNPDHLTKGEMEGRRQAMLAIEALKQFNPGCENAKLRNFGMTLGVRDTRKIDAVYNMTAQDVREQGTFYDSIGIFPEFYRWLRHSHIANYRSLFSATLPIYAAQGCASFTGDGTLCRR